MKPLSRFLSIANATTLGWVIGTTNTIAQIVPDSTLPNSSAVNLAERILEITGGTSAGANLFHSFQEFSVSQGQTAYFNNAANIENIIARVTGRSISNIDGLIRANGSANLFLLNPNGILFGPNAALNLGGSFFATSAEQITFADGREFSASNPESALFSINVPIGLQFNGNSGAIVVQGTQLNRPSLAQSESLSEIGDREFNFQQDFINHSAGLRVQPGEAIALIGGEIQINGGLITASQGRIAIAAIRQGAIITSNQASLFNASFNILPQSLLGNIQLSEKAALFTSGNQGGVIQIFGDRVSLTGGSEIQGATLGAGMGATVTIRADDLLEIRGTRTTPNVPSVIGAQSFATGNGGTITLETEQLILNDGSQVLAGTYGAGTAGMIVIRPSETAVSPVVELSGLPDVELTALAESLDASAIAGTGNAGAIAIETGRLIVRDGARIGVQTFTAGEGGIITVNAADSIEVRGVDRNNPLASHLSAGTFSNSNAGSVRIQTRQLRVSEGAAIGAFSTQGGDAGVVSINASDFVELVGTSGNSDSQTTLSATTSSTGNAGSIEVITDRLQMRDGALISASTFGTGAGGNIAITVENLSVENGSQITVRGESSGNPGNIAIAATQFNMINNSNLTATSATGRGGNIGVRSRNILLRRNSEISATGSQSGNLTLDGNIAIAAETLTLLENGRIITSASDPAGGSNITLRPFNDANLIILKSPDSLINAVGELNIEGDIEPEAITIPEMQLMNLEGLIAQTCQIDQGSQFIITGRGGLPPNPTQVLSPPSVILDWATSAERSRDRQSLRTHPPISHATTQLPTLVEAQGWVINAQGKIILTATATNVTTQSLALPAQNCIPTFPSSL